MIRKPTLIPAAAALWIAGALAAAGCAPGGYYNSSRSALDSLLTSQAELMKRVGTLEKKVDATREGLQATRANNEAKMAEISQRLDVLGGQLEESGAKFTRLAQKVDTVKQRLGSADSVRAARGATFDSTGTPDAEAMYQAAYSDVAAGRYNLARESFQTYLRYFSDTEVADNAQYWIGECSYATGDFAGAIPEFQKVVQNYPKADKVPSALLKIGLSYSRLKNADEANKYYRMLIQKYPKSSEAAAARERLPGPETGGRRSKTARSG
ncbi:MAG: tol-pal system protein YbgF [Candidatus Eisenbacteria bacterium]|uniref:Tol-pal system protein YbgF n=1 Tax=Eiseniibacteriota bacterium TaxID=2212470 RepID=A0A538TIH7_UNCEI|nr:MAG: tol-pal system protein YbgF [Candidatus Eisenbacteria bacterium]